LRPGYCIACGDQSGSKVQMRQLGWALAFVASLLVGSTAALANPHFGTFEDIGKIEAGSSFNIPFLTISSYPNQSYFGPLLDVRYAIGGNVRFYGTVKNIGSESVTPANPQLQIVFNFTGGLNTDDIVISATLSATGTLWPIPSGMSLDVSYLWDFFAPENIGPPGWFVLPEADWGPLVDGTVPFTNVDVTFLMSFDSPNLVVDVPKFDLLGRVHVDYEFAEVTQVSEPSTLATLLANLLLAGTLGGLFGRRRLIG
jgi:hypothetical protein